MIGVDASHAWAAVRLPDGGWLGSTRRTTARRRALHDGGLGPRLRRRPAAARGDLHRRGAQRDGRLGGRRARSDRLRHRGRARACSGSRRAASTGPTSAAARRSRRCSARWSGSSSVTPESACTIAQTSAVSARTCCGSTAPSERTSSRRQAELQRLLADPEPVASTSDRRAGATPRSARAGRRRPRPAGSAPPHPAGPPPCRTAPAASWRAGSHAAARGRLRSRRPAPRSRRPPRGLRRSAAPRSRSPDRSPRPARPPTAMTSPPSRTTAGRWRATSASSSLGHLGRVARPGVLGAGLDAPADRPPPDLVQHVVARP